MQGTGLGGFRGRWGERGQPCANERSTSHRWFEPPCLLRSEAATRIHDPGVRRWLIACEVGTGKAEDEKAPLSEIIEVLNKRFGTAFTE